MFQTGEYFSIHCIQFNGVEILPINGYAPGMSRIPPEINILFHFKDSQIKKIRGIMHHKIRHITHTFGQRRIVNSSYIVAVFD